MHDLKFLGSHLRSSAAHDQRRRLLILCCGATRHRWRSLLFFVVAILLLVNQIEQAIGCFSSTDGRLEHILHFIEIKAAVAFILGSRSRSHPLRSWHSIVHAARIASHTFNLTHQKMALLVKKRGIYRGSPDVWRGIELFRLISDLCTQWQVLQERQQGYVRLWLQLVRLAAVERVDATRLMAHDLLRYVCLPVRVRLLTWCNILRRMCLLSVLEEARRGCAQEDWRR